MNNPERVTYFAATDSRGKRTPFGIKAKDRAKHMYVIGKTGMGKSTLLENMAIQDILNGEGLAFIDPHGGTADKLLEYVPEHRINDVVYFAPFDLEHPVAFNVMEDVGYDKRHLVVSGLMATFKKIWVDAWSARMEYILSNTLLALLEYPGATLLGVNRMYTDKVYRKKVIDNVKDPVVKDFWIKEFNTYTDRYTQEATPAIQNKIGQFTSNPLIRNIIGQPTSSFDIRDLMDRKKILIMNLSKGLVGETNMRLLGSMLTTRIFLGAMSRAELSARDIENLPDFYFYVDEFQNFANETFADILSEARKYKLNLVIANQYIKQLENKDDSTVKDAVFGNVGTTVAFRVGPFDAEVLETVFSPEFLMEDLVNLGKAQIYLSLMIDGVGSRPFSAITIPPIEAPARTFKTEVVQASRSQFGNVREGIETVIYEELASSGDAPPEPAPKKSYAPKRDESGAGARTERTRTDAPRRESNDRPRSEARSDVSDRPRSESRGDGDERPKPSSSDRSRDVRRDAPRGDVRPAPPKERSSEDLKSILRSTIEKAQKEKEVVDTQKHASLKEVLSSTAVKEERPIDPGLAPRPVHEGARGEGPFEIPEETLRSIFKDA